MSEIDDPIKFEEGEPIEPAEGAVGFDVDIKNLPEEKLSEIARGIVKNEIFTSDHIHPNQRGRMISSVFMCAALGGFEGWTEDQLSQIGFLYAPIADAGPMAVNGYPMFFSMGYVNKHDARVIWQKVDVVKKAMEVI